MSQTCNFLNPVCAWRQSFDNCQNPGRSIYEYETIFSPDFSLLCLIQVVVAHRRNGIYIKSLKGQAENSNLPTTVLLLFALYNPQEMEDFYLSSKCGKSPRTVCHCWVHTIDSRLLWSAQERQLSGVTNAFEMGVRAFTLTRALCRTLRKSSSTFSIKCKKEGISTALSRIFFSVCKLVCNGIKLFDLSLTGYWWSQSLDLE